MTLVCRPTPFVRFMHASGLSALDLRIAWHDSKTRSCFYPQPCAVEPAETRLGWKRATELKKIYNR